MNKRQEFENSQWVTAADGYPSNPKADPQCQACNGHGVVEDGELSMFAFIPINCQKCWRDKPSQEKP